MNNSKNRFHITLVMLVSLAASSILSTFTPLSGVHVLISHDVPQEAENESQNLGQLAVWACGAAVVGYILWKQFWGEKVDPAILRALVDYHPADDGQGETAQSNLGSSKLTNNSQVFYCEVRQQLGLSCALHAADNGSYALKALQEADVDLKTLENNLRSDDFHPCRVGEWGSAIRIHGSLDHDNLAFVMRTLSGLAQQNYTIIPSINAFNPVELDAERLATTLAQLRGTHGATHLFLLGNMSHHQSMFGGLTGTYGHWIAVVVKRVHGQLKYYVMDSLNGRRTTMVHNLRRLVENAQLNGLLQVAKFEKVIVKIESRFNAEGVKSPIQERITESLKELGEIAGIVEQFVLRTDRSFQELYVPRIKRILRTIDGLIKQNGLQSEVKGLDALVKQFLGN